MGIFKSPEHKLKVLAWAQLLWEALEAFELLKAHPHILRVIQAALWPFSSFCREALVGCYECDFKDFSTYTTQDLSDAARAFGVKAIEDLHRCLNVKAHQNYNGKCSRTLRWHTAQTAGLVEEIDRKQPDPTDEQRRTAATNTLPNTSYQATHSEYSLGEEIHKDLLSDKEHCLSNVYIRTHYI